MDQRILPRAGGSATFGRSARRPAFYDTIMKSYLRTIGSLDDCFLGHVHDRAKADDRVKAGGGEESCALSPKEEEDEEEGAEDGGGGGGARGGCEAKRCTHAKENYACIGKLASCVHSAPKAGQLVP